MRTNTRFLWLSLVVLAFGIILAAPAAAQDDMGEAHKATVRRFADFFNAGDAEVLLEITADGYVDHTPFGDATTEGLVGANAGLRAAMPDLVIWPQIILSDGDWAAVRWLLVGTMTGDYPNADGSIVPANDQQIVVEVHQIHQFNDSGEIAETWEVFDALSFLTQIGAICDCEVPAVEADTSEWEITETSEEAEAELRASIADTTDRVFNQGEVDLLDERFAPDYVSHPDEGNRESFKRFVEATLTAMPDYQSTADPLIVEGNYAMFAYTFGGTFENELAPTPEMAIPPTGGPVSATAIILVKTNDAGQIVEEWDALDQLGYLTQLGVIPAPEA